MCTVTLISSEPGRYVLGGNRDEQKTREPGLPPRCFSINNVNYVAPTDARAGGTWIAVNEFGLTLAILNRYSGNVEQPGLSENPPSRGIIIPALIQLKSIDKITASINEIIRVQQYRPFTLIAVDHSPVNAQRWDWNGGRFTRTKLMCPPKIWVSSGREQEKITRIREKVFSRIISKHTSDDLETIKRVHESEEPQPGPAAISMEYKHVQSVSGTIVETGGQQIRMHHCNSRPLPGKTWDVITLSHKKRRF